jgi:hypothetical protein
VGKGGEVKLKKGIILALVLVLAVNIGAVTALAGPAKDRGGATDREFVEEVFIDYADDTHAGPGPHPTTESDRYHLTQGGIRWFSGGTVYYRFQNIPSGFESAVSNAISTMDAFVTTRDFDRNDASPSPNPCTPGEGNTVSWTYIDGVEGVLAMASVCRDVVTKEIVGFRVTFDSSEPWTTDPVAEPDKYDVENAAAHEFIHVAGLGHVNAPWDGCLTMYRYVGPGEIQKRTLGWGDKLGLSELYPNVPDTDPGMCGQ